MKQLIVTGIFFLLMSTMHAQTDFRNYPVYKGNDLGLTYSPTGSRFKIWSPGASAATIILYKDGTGGQPMETRPLKKSGDGTWQITLPGERKGIFYAFSVKVNGKWSNEVPDPYAKAVGVNGRRAMVVSLGDTDPPGWKTDRSPDFSATNTATDAVIYELHIRDASIDPGSGIEYRGKYLGLAQTGTKTEEGLATGLDHLKELGVTHIHLLPFFDFNSIDETDTAKPAYNWGYDPLNYNVPEGSYSTNPYDGVTRIIELKKMIAAFHRNGLRVVMDVVYNHVANAASSNFNQLVPGYYFRHKKDGSLSDATACGNETASEMPMMRKFMLESLLYWVNEYHIDGFRFDLMGVHDITTMNLISKTLHTVKPGILLYGEGWTAGASPLPDSMRALKKNAWRLDRVAVFSDDVRDGIKGSVFEEADRGFVSGKPGMEESIKFGVVAACKHPQVDINKVNYSKKPYAASPANTVTYCECHDNNTLWDKLQLSCPGTTAADREKMQKLALTIVLTSQGIPFLHAGTEFLRSKQGVENSYNAGDSINAITWKNLGTHREVTKYVEALIEMRRQHPAFRLPTAALVQQCIRFYNQATPGTVVYTLDGKKAGDTWKQVFVAFNGNREEATVLLPEGNWTAAMTGEEDKKQLYAHSCIVPAYGAVILYR